jgi:ubiquinol-cytochrome c reductase cytochrome b subunit
MGWLEGALRLAPGWRIHLFGYTISELFWPGVVLPSLTFGLLYLWPFLERRVTHDTGDHHLLDRPRDRPVRTAIGVGALTFYVVLFLAGSQDIGAQKLAVDIPTLTRVFQVMTVVLPVLVALLTWKVCRDLAGGDELESKKEEIRHGLTSVERPQPSPAPAAPVERPPLILRVVAGGVLAAAALRRALSRKTRSPR